MRRVMKVGQYILNPRNIHTVNLHVYLKENESHGCNSLDIHKYRN